MVGAVGYIGLFIAPLTRTRASFVFWDVAGMTPVGIHYIMLGSPAGAIMCVIYVLKDFVALGLGRPFYDRLYWSFYPLTIISGFLVWQGWADMVAIAGGLFAVAARHQTSIPKLKLLVFFSALGWGSYGFLSGSISQLVFSTFYAGSSLYAFVRDVRDAKSA